MHPRAVGQVTTWPPCAPSCRRPLGVTCSAHNAHAGGRPSAALLLLVCDSLLTGDDPFGLVCRDGAVVPMSPSLRAGLLERSELWGRTAALRCLALAYRALPKASNPPQPLARRPRGTCLTAALVPCAPLR